MVKFSDLFEFQIKSKIMAGHGQELGRYPFYTSIAEQVKFLDDYLFEGESLIMGTGGNASIHFNENKFSVSTDCLVAQPIKGQRMLTKCYYYYLKSNIRLLQQGFKGAGLKHTSKGYIASIELPEIAFDRQMEIVAGLDLVEKLRQMRKQSVQLIDGFLHAMFIDMFGDPMSNPRRLEVKKIGDIGQVITGNTPSRQKSEYYGNHIEWIKSDNINTPQFTLTKAKEYLSCKGTEVGRIAPKGSVLVTCIAGSPECIGNVAMAELGVACNQQINAFVPGVEISQKVFFAQVLFCKELIQQASTNGMKGLVSKGKFCDTKILVPPKDQQDKFDQVFNKVACLRDQFQMSALELENQFNALIQTYFGCD